MPKINIVKNHSVSLDEATTRVKKLVEEFATDFSRIVSNVTWSSDGRSADAKGKGFKGRFAVDERQVRVDVDLSMFATPFKARVETGVSGKLDAAFPE